MRLLPILAGLVLSGLLVAACDGGSDAEPTATAPGIDTPAPTATVAADDRRSGIAELDAVLDAVLSHDLEAVRGLVAFENVPCIGPTPGSLGALFCEEGEEPGTNLQALPAAQCEGHYIRADDMDQALLSMAGATVELYAVTSTDDGYRAVFSRRVGPDGETALGHTLSVQDGRIASVNFGCGETAEELFESVSPDDVVLPPRG